MINQQKIIAEIVKTTGVKLEVNDPALLLVAINELAFGDMTQKIDEQLSQSADKFHKVAISNLDDFIEVANEAISKFTTSTKQLRAAIDAVPLNPKTAEPSIQVIKDIPKSDTPLLDEFHKALKPHIYWAFPFAVLVGFVFGLLTAYAIF